MSAETVDATGAEMVGPDDGPCKHESDFGAFCHDCGQQIKPRTPFEQAYHSLYNRLPTYTPYPAFNQADIVKLFNKGVELGCQTSAALIGVAKHRAEEAALRNIELVQQVNELARRIDEDPLQGLLAAAETREREANGSRRFFSAECVRLGKIVDTLTADVARLNEHVEAAEAIKARDGDTIRTYASHQHRNLREIAELTAQRDLLKAALDKLGANDARTWNARYLPPEQYCGANGTHDWHIVGRVPCPGLRADGLPRL